MGLDKISRLKAVLFFFHSSMTIIISYLPVYFRDTGLSDSEIGILMAVGPLAAMFAQPFWGFTTDRLETMKKVIMICITGGMVFGFFVFQFNSFLMLIPLVFLFFSFMSPVGGLNDSLAQKVSIQEGVSFGSIRMWGSLGFGISSLAGGYILSAIGLEYIFYVFFFYSLLALLFCWYAPDRKPSNKPAKLKNAAKLLIEPKLMLFLMMIIFITITHRTSDTFIGIYIQELGGTETLIGWAWFIGVVTEAAVFAFSIYWFRKFHPLTFMTLAAALYFLRWVLMTVAPDPTFVLFIQVLHGICFGIFYLSAFQFINRIIPEELQATGHLLFISVFFGLSGVVGSSLGGVIIDYAGASYLYQVLSYSAFIGLVGSLLYRLYYNRNTEKEKAVA
ncbi:MFS transporter [Texcoconibacillus texcoconensis]|uniref:PPP family 3-phenylpropionic acid transporter n=1 Tax=Texcoconibacillus texcoconensis TaxID=1095777 RepID=A0A840QT81_9BACI|nr:MFS transporter [Texcoconibacillus texcoconensis]MBB5174477.1 PPP family 3-phenylpropionic acid transporter [Texcoconibacillus texcoconensis]